MQELGQEMVFSLSQGSSLEARVSGGSLPKHTGSVSLRRASQPESNIIYLLSSMPVLPILCGGPGSLSSSFMHFSIADSVGLSLESQSLSAAAGLHSSELNASSASLLRFPELHATMPSDSGLFPARVDE